MKTQDFNWQQIAVERGGRIEDLQRDLKTLRSQYDAAVEQFKADLERITNELETK